MMKFPNGWLRLKEIYFGTMISFISHVMRRFERASNSIFLGGEIRVARGYLTFGLSVWSWGPRPTSNIDGIIADNLRRRLLRVLHFSHPSLVSHVRPLVLQLSFPLLPTSSFHHSSLPHFARREGTAFCSQLRNLAIVRIIYMQL